MRRLTAWWLVGCALVVAVIAATTLVYVREDERRTDEQHATEQRALEALRTSVGDALRRQTILSGAISATGVPSAPAFPSLAGIVAQQPLANLAGFVEPVAERDRRAFERRLGAPLKEAVAGGGFRPAAPRENHYVLTRFTRQAELRPLLGVDFATDPVRRQLLERTAAGTQSATMPLKLITPGAPLGIIVYEGVRDRGGRLAGWIIVAYRGDRLAESARRQFPGVQLRIRDGAAPLSNGRLDGSPTIRRFAVAGRQWTAAASAPRDGMSSAPWLVLLLGLSTSALVMLVLRRSIRGERQAEARYRTLAEQMPASAVMLVDGDLRVAYARGRRFETKDVNPDDLVGRPVREAPSDPEVGARFEAVHRRALAGEELELQMRSGPHTYLLHAAPVRDADGAVSGALSVALDITAQVEAQTALEASEERYRLITERSTDLVARFDAAGRFLWASPSWSQLGHDPEALVGTDAFALGHPDDVGEARAVVGALRPGAWEPLVWTGRFRSATGSWVWLESMVRGYGDPATGELEEIQCTLRDVTARVRADAERDAAREALATSEARYRAVVDQLAEGIVVQDSGSQILACNAAAEYILGLSAAEIRGRVSIDDAWFTIYEDGTRRPGAELPAPVALRTGEPVFDEVVGVRKPDGSVTWLRESVTLLRHADGEAPYASVACFSDITAEREQRATLERERRDLQEAQAVARIGSWDYDLVRDRPGRWSAELWRMMGLDPQPVSPTIEAFVAMVHPDDRDRVGTRFAAALEDRKAFSDEFRVRAAGGHELHVAFRGEVQHDDLGRPVSAYGTVQDITERAQRDAEQVALREIAELVADGAGPAAVFGAVAEQVRELFGAQAGAISRFDASAGVGRVVSASSGSGEDLSAVTFELDGVSASAEVYRTGEPARVDGPLVSSTDPVAAIAARAGYSSMAAAPIVVNGRPWGALGVAHAGRPAPGGVELRLAHYTRLVAMAIANADAWDTLSRQASTDALTGLANHRAFHDRLREEVTRAGRYGRDLTVALLDLDHFKSVNDTHGHQVGDRILALVAERLSSEVRAGELLARVGGEEFAWLMPETSPEGAYSAADRARRAIEAEPFDGVGTITVSVGVCASEGGRDGSDLMRFADRALYWAKDGGRNSTFLYTEEAHALLAAQARTSARSQTMSSVRALARAIDHKDPSTHQHAERVASLAERIALRLGWDHTRARLLHTCGLLHDVGKIGIPDDVLLKPGPLTPDETVQIRRHAEMGAHICAEVLEPEQVAWVRGHHERWDGRGYPDGLSAERIPDGAQILAIADAWDVMTENRLYSAARTVEAALAECRHQQGLQFAPVVVDALAAVIVIDQESRQGSG